MTVSMKKLAEELEEIKGSLNFMSGEISKVVTQQAKLVGLLEDVRVLKASLRQRDEKIDKLEQRIDDLEQYSRVDDIIISGLDIRPRTYAKAVAGHQSGEDAPSEEQLTVEKQVVQFMNSKHIHIEPVHISACHMLPRKAKDGNKAKPAIIVRFVNRKYKVAVLSQYKKLRDTGVYVNEHLTGKNAEIASSSRILKKRNKIQSTWTRNGKVFIKTNGAAEHARVVMVRRLSELDVFK